MATTNADLIFTLLLVILGYLLYQARNVERQHLPRWWRSCNSYVERNLGHYIFDHGIQYVDKAVTLTILTKVRQYFAILLTLNWSLGYLIIGALRVGVHLCEYPISRPYAEPFGFCIQPNIVPETAMPWYTNSWVEQTEGAEVTPILLSYVEPIFIGDLQMNAIRESLQFRAEKLHWLLPDDSEARSVTQCLHKIVNETALIQSDWEHFGWQFSIGKDIVNHQLRIFLDIFNTLVSQKHYPMWSLSIIISPAYHAACILRRMTRGLLGPEPWLYNIEVEIEMRYRANLIDETVNGLLGRLDQQSRQSHLIEEAMTRIAREMQRVEEARSHPSWPRFLYISKEAEALAYYQELLKQIKDCLHLASVVIANWETSHTKIMSSLRSLKDSMIPSTWNEFSPFRFSPTRFSPAGSSTVSQSTSTQVPNPLTTTHGNNSETLAPLDKLFTYKLARLSPAELSNATSAIISLCKSGDLYGNSKERLFPICIIYQSLSILSEIDGAALTDRPRSWLQARGTARDEVERQNYGSIVTSEDIRRLSEQNLHLGSKS